MKQIVLIISGLVISSSAFAQTEVRKPGESLQAFISRLVPEGASKELKPVENSFGTGNKIVVFCYSKMEYDSVKKDSVRCLFASALFEDRIIKGKYIRQNIDLGCNKDFDVGFEGAEATEWKKVKYLRITTFQLVKGSRRILVKDYNENYFKPQLDASTGFMSFVVCDECPKHED